MDGLRKSFVVLTVAFLALLLCACQPTAVATPTPTRHPTATPTITPTPLPLDISGQDFLKDCQALDEQDRMVNLTGRIFLPDAVVYGYEGWYGLNLISTENITVLFSPGSGPNTMDELPEYFTAKDLVIRSADNQVIREGHRLFVTGKAKYRANSEERRCELFVDNVEAIEDPGLLVPLELTVHDLIIQDPDGIDECNDFELRRQLISLQGSLTVDDYFTSCTYAYCRVLFSDGTGTIPVYISRGGGPNSMLVLPEDFTWRDLQVFDNREKLVDYQQVNITGVAEGFVTECSLFVYEIE